MLRKQTISLVFTLLVVTASAHKCARLLENLLFEPQTYAQEYLNKVAHRFRASSELLFTAQADSFVQSFEQQWGVSVQVQEPFTICTNNSVTLSYAVTQTFTEGGGAYEINVPENFDFTDLTVFITGNPESSIGLGTYTLVKVPLAYALASSSICPGQSQAAPFSIGFADSSTATFDCSNQNAGTYIAPSSPLSSFVGVNSSGIWGLNASNGAALVLNSTTLTFSRPSFQITCTRDVMKALTNIPGFRYDSASQTAYYSEEFFDPQGNMKMVSISRPINGIYLK